MKPLQLGLNLESRAQQGNAVATKLLWRVINVCRLNTVVVVALLEALSKPSGTTYLVVICI